MHRLIRILRKMQGLFRKKGWTGLSGFVAWLFQLLFEKSILSIEAWLPYWWPRRVFTTGHESARAALKSHVDSDEPVLTVILQIGDSRRWVRSTLRSLVNQANPSWECILCCPDNAQNNSWKAECRDDRVRILDVPGMNHPEFLVSQVIAQVHGKWLLIARAGDKYDPSLVDRISNGRGNIQYWDEALYKGPFDYSPFLKPDWSPELWLSVDLLRCAAFSMADLPSAKRQTNTERISARVAHAKTISHIPVILTLCRRAAWSDVDELRQHAATVNEYLQLTNFGKPQVGIQDNKRISLKPIDNPGLISIIIPTKDNLFVVQRCLDSIWETTAGADFEVILVDDHSEDPATLDYYRQMRQQHRNIRIIHTQQKFNFSRSCNLGALKSKGKFLLFLNNDVEVKTPNWLKRLMTVASLKGVGVVGAKLVYPGGKIQHAGIVLGLEGHASHVFIGSTGKKQTPFGSIDWYRNFSAVTGACMLVRREAFNEINGFDEAFELIFGDVDFCLRLRGKGYRIVYSPDVVLIHHEGKTRGRLNPAADIKLGYDRFKVYIDEGDPYYHPKISRAWRIPVFRKTWEQDPTDRIKSIIKYGWY